MGHLTILVKFMFSKKATKLMKSSPSIVKIGGEDFVNFCDFLRKREVYLARILGMKASLFFYST